MTGLGYIATDRPSCGKLYFIPPKETEIRNIAGCLTQGTTKRKKMELIINYPDEEVSNGKVVVLFKKKKVQSLFLWILPKNRCKKACEGDKLKAK